MSTDGEFRIYTLKPDGFAGYDGFSRHATRWVATGFLGLVALLTTPCVALRDTRPSFIKWLILPVVLSLSAFTLWRDARRGAATRRASWLSYRVALGPNTLRVVTAGSIPAELARSQVLRITEDPLGLRLYAAARRMDFSRSLDGYDDLRARLGAWRPIESTAKPGSRLRLYWRLPTAEQLRARPGHEDERLELERIRQACPVPFTLDAPPPGEPRRGQKALVLGIVLVATSALLSVAYWLFRPW